jgi:hypothetical protein
MRAQRTQRRGADTYAPAGAVWHCTIAAAGVVRGQPCSILAAAAAASVHWLAGAAAGAAMGVRKSAAQLSAEVLTPTPLQCWSSCWWCSGLQ